MYKKSLFFSAVIVLLLGFADSTMADPNLVGHWKLDTDANDYSGNSHHGTIVGDPCFVTGQIDGALDFNGLNDYVNTNSADLDLAGTDTITVSAWIYPRTTLGDTTHLISDYNKNDTLGWFVSFSTSDKFGATNIDSVNSRTRVSSALALNQWHHVVAIISPTGSPNIYINGQLDNDSSSGGDPTTQLYMGSGNVMIGRQSTPDERYFNGKIDHVRIYNRALSVSEISQLTQEGTDEALTPNPADGQTKVDPNIVLSWYPGRWAADVNGHDVYLGTNYNDVNNANTTITYGVYQGREDSNSFDPGGLDWGQLYYWRVDEVNGAGATVKGDIWSFTVLYDIEPFFNNVKPPYASIERKNALYEVDDLTHLDLPHSDSLKDMFFNRYQKALDNIKATEVKTGAVVWNLYNMAYIVKTPDITVGFDLIRLPVCLQKGGSQKYEDQALEAVELCDILFISHRHGDHADAFVAAEFLSRGKPVFAPVSIFDHYAFNETEHGDIQHPERDGLAHIVNVGSVGLTVRNYPGHQNDLENNYTFVTFPSGITVGHSGDQCNGDDFSWIANVHTQVDVDILISNNWTENPIAVVNGIKPTAVLPSHVNEMAHSIETRISYEYSYEHWDNVNAEMINLLWGESYILNATQPPPDPPTNPAPANNTNTFISVETNLSWTAGAGAVSHNVYLGTASGDLDLVSSGQSGTTYHSGILADNTTFYWQIGEVDSVGAVTTGLEWSFTRDDLDIDLNDFAVFALAWRSDNTPTSNWNPGCDISQPADGIIDEFDLDVLCEKWLRDYLTESLVAHFKLDSDVNDSSGYDNHGTIYGAPCFVTGQIDDALDFDGDGDYVSFSSISALQSDNVTICAWIYAHDLMGAGGNKPILYQCNSSDDGYDLYAWEGRPSLWMGGGYIEAISPEIIDENRWYHIAGTYDGFNLKIYVNAVLKNTISSVGLSGVNQPAYIGYDAVWLDFFDGIIDDVRIYNRALDANEIDQIYQDTISP